MSKKGEDALEAWRRWYAENHDPIFDVFVGPCMHGRDPFTRCETCGELPPEEAKALAEAARTGIKQ